MRVISQVLNFSEKDRMQEAKMVAQLQGADGDLLNITLDAAEIDLLTLPECVIDWEEDAGEHVMGRAS